MAENEDHPSVLLEKGKKYDEAIQALKEAKDMLKTKGYKEHSLDLVGINKVLNDNERLFPGD